MERLDGYRIALLGAPGHEVKSSLAALGAALTQIGPGTPVPLEPSLLGRFDALWSGDEPPGASDAEVIEFLRRWDGERKPLVLVGDSVRRWLRAGPPRDLLVTGPEDVRDLAFEAGQRWIDAPAVRDANLVTARSAVEAGVAIECALELFSEHHGTGVVAPREPGTVIDRPAGGPHPGLEPGGG